MATAPPRTHLAFHHDAKLHTLAARVTAIHAFSSLPEPARLLFKTESFSGNDDDPPVVVVTDKTIFHPQGGGQPSDEGTMTSPATTFSVRAARTDADGQVLHLGHFSPPSPAPRFSTGDEVQQTLDADKRALYSRLHTAGHVLGAAVRRTCGGGAVPGFDELKASHFPGSAACEFAGRIGAEWRGAIQDQVDAFVAAALPVVVEWWDEDEFRRRGLERLLVGMAAVPPGEKFRVVNIVGAEVYPCGGTHVDSTDLCGETRVTRISRSKGQSRVSYTVA